MKKIIFILLLLPFICNAQYESHCGYFASGIFDTVKAVFLVTDNIVGCNGCPTKSVKGYVVREKYVYSGDPMPPLTYAPRWDDTYFLDNWFNDINIKYIVWNYKIKE